MNIHNKLLVNCYYCSYIKVMINVECERITG